MSAQKVINHLLYHQPLIIIKDRTALPPLQLVIYVKIMVAG